MKNCFRFIPVLVVSFCLLCSVSITLAKVYTPIISDKIKTAAVPFMVNQGQFDKNVSFYTSTFGGALFVTRSGELVYKLPKIDIAEAKPNNGKKEIRYSGGVVLRERFVNAKIEAITAFRETVAKVNYFRGGDSSKWQNGIPAYEELSLGEIYDGVDLRLKAYAGNVEKIFHVQPETDPTVITLSIDGADSLQVLSSGELQASTSLGDIKFTKPIAWQDINGHRIPVTISYKIVSGASKLMYAFHVGTYDKAFPLIIDPLLASTFIGGYNHHYPEYAKAVALDSNGNVYVAGKNDYRDDYPTTTGAYDTTFNGGFGDFVISKFTPDLSTLIASTYLGGNSEDDVFSITLDSENNVYVVGETSSTDFPTTAGAYYPDRDWSYSSCITVSKLSSDLSTLLASTYLEGTIAGIVDGDYITLDAGGNVYIAGNCSPSTKRECPTTDGAYDTTFNGSWTDAFIYKLSSDLSTLMAGTFLGGVEADVANAITVDDRTGNVYVTGYTSSPDYPTTANAYDTTYNGGTDFIISKLTSNLDTLLASTFLGGSSVEQNSLPIALDSSGNVYVTSNTLSPDYPITTGAYDQTFIGFSDIVISKFSSNLETLVASTYLGGAKGEESRSITLDDTGNVYVTGNTDSPDYPISANPFDRTLNGRTDGIISKLSSNLETLLYSTYLGGKGNEKFFSIALDNLDNVYVTGRSNSIDYPTTLGAYDRTLGICDPRDKFCTCCSSDIIISKLSLYYSFSWPLFYPSLLDSTKP